MYKNLQIQVDYENHGICIYKDWPNHFPFVSCDNRFEILDILLTCLITKIVKCERVMQSVLWSIMFEKCLVVKFGLLVE